MMTKNKENIDEQKQTQDPEVSAPEETIGADHELEEPGKDPMALMETELAETKDRLLRLYSEFENYKKRTLKERIDLVKFGGEEIFKSMLPVLDDLERAMQSMETATDVEALKNGVNLIHSKLKNTLAQKGLEEMKPVDEPFDSDVHEAITNMPVEDASKKGKVVDVIEKGYALHGKVIRYAKVVVGQ